MIKRWSHLSGHRKVVVIRALRIHRNPVETFRLPYRLHVKNNKKLTYSPKPKRPKEAEMMTL